MLPWKQHPVVSRASGVATERPRWARLRAPEQQSCGGRNHGGRRSTNPGRSRGGRGGNGPCSKYENTYSVHSVAASSPVAPAPPARADVEHLSKSLSACGGRRGSVWPQPSPVTQACAAEREKAASVLRTEKESTQTAFQTGIDSLPCCAGHSGTVLRNSKLTSFL